MHSGVGVSLGPMITNDFNHILAWAILGSSGLAQDTILYITIPRLISLGYRMVSWARLQLSKPRCPSWCHLVPPRCPMLSPLGVPWCSRVFLLVSPWYPLVAVVYPPGVPWFMRWCIPRCPIRCPMVCLMGSCAGQTWCLFLKCTRVSPSA